MPSSECYAVIFTSLRAAGNSAEYAAAADRMAKLAAQQPGYLGIESARGDDGVGITVSYWESLEATAAWRRDAEHRAVQELGRTQWYEWYRLRVCKVVREASFP